MRIQKIDDTSFKQFRCDSKGRRALVKLVSETDEAAIDTLGIMLTEFKKQGDGFANALDRGEKTEGIDLVVTQYAGEETSWNDYPSIIFKKGKSQVEGTTRFIIDELMSNVSENAISKKLTSADLRLRSFELAAKFQSWFVENHIKLVKSTPAEKETPASEFIKGIFG